MSIPYTSTVPQASQTIASTQPIIQQNFGSIDAIWQVDHYSFSESTGGKVPGQHEQVTFPIVKAIAATAGTPVVVATAANAQDVSVSEVWAANKNITYQLSPIKAWASFIPSAVPTFTGNQKVNVSSITYVASPWSYVVTLPANTVTDINYAVIATAGRKSTAPTTDIMAVNYAIQSATQFTLYVASVNNVPDHPTVITFQVMQV